MNIVITLIIMLLLTFAGYGLFCMIKPSLILKMLEKIHSGRLTIWENDVIVLDVQGKNRGKHGVIHVKDLKTFLNHVASGGEPAVGEMYMNGLWTSPDIISLVTVFIDNQDVLIRNKPKTLGKNFDTDKEDIRVHYDAGNDFYMAILKDSKHVYSSGIWRAETDTLESAQNNKLITIMQKMDAQKDQRILDIGCGWGYVGDYISQKTGCVVDGISISGEQLKFIKENLKNINGIHMHYMNLPSEPKYDKAYSLEMFEHVRCVNYLDFFKKVHGCLKPNGRFVMQTITYNIPRNQRCDAQNVSFVTKHVFQNGQIAMRDWIISASTAAGFATSHIEVYGGHHYYKTLKAWRDNLLSSAEYLKSIGHTDAIIRKYEYYFTSCAAGFMTDNLNVTHFVFDKVDYLDESIDNNYLSVRNTRDQ